jgi:hypothetical protein
MMRNPSAVRASFDLEDIHDISLDVLQLLEDEEVEVAEAAVALALSLGRIIAPKTLEQDEQIKFTQDLMEWAGCYFAEGQVN